MKITSYIDRLGLRIADFAINRPIVALLSCLLLVTVTAPGLSKLAMSSEYRAFYGPDNPQLIAFDNVEQSYNKLDNLVFVIRTEGKPALGVDTYPIIQFLTDRAWQLPAVLRVDSLSNYQHTSVDRDELIVEDFLADYQTYSVKQLEQKELIALDEPLLAGNLLSDDGTTTAINVVTLFTSEPGQDIGSFYTEAQALARETEATYPGTRIAITGTIAMSSTFTEAGLIDAQTLIPGMYLVLLIALLIVYRSISATVTTFVVVSTSTMVPLGIFGFTGIELTSLSAIAPIIIMTLAVADSVHILITVLTLMRGGMNKRDALRESLRVNFLAVSVTSITTVIGFLCLNFSDTPPYHHLGNVSSMGILTAWLFSVVLLPAVMVLLPVRIKARASNSDNASTRLMTSLAKFTTSRHKPILVTFVVLSAAIISQLPKLELNDHFIQFFDKRIQFRADTDFIQEHLGGAFTIQYDLKSGKPEGVNDPAYLQTLEDFSVWLRRDPFVTSVYSYSDIAKRLNRNMHGDDAAFYRVPEDQELAAQYLLLYELSLPYGLDLNDRINFDKSASRLTATLDNPTAMQIRAFSERSRQWLQDHAAQPMWVEPTGTALLFSHISARNIDSMIVGNTVAIVAIALVLMVALGHVGLGALSMLPNILPVALALSLWAILVGMAGMATTIVAASSLGIVVDNTTHFLSKYIRARREQGKNKEAAIAYSFETVGVAIIANGLVLMCGFAILAFSTFQPNMQMGLLTAMTIALALLVDMICLPALLMLGGKDKDKSAS